MAKCVNHWFWCKLKNIASDIAPEWNGETPPDYIQVVDYPDRDTIRLSYKCWCGEYT